MPRLYCLNPNVREIIAYGDPEFVWAIADPIIHKVNVNEVLIYLFIYIEERLAGEVAAWATLVKIRSINYAS